MKTFLSPAALFLAIALLFASAGCNSSQNQKNTNNDNGSAKTKENVTSTDDHSSSDSQKSDSQNSDNDSNLEVKPNTSPSNQEILSKAGSALHTNVPVLVPSNVPTAKNTYLTATTKSSKDHYQITFLQSDNPVPVNDPSLKSHPDDWVIATLSGTVYKNRTEADQQFQLYQKITQKNLDLGNGIKAFSEGAAGHAYIGWNEGRWFISVDSPSDPTYSNTGDQGKKIAMSVAAYLHDHMLPPPHQHGIIMIDNWKKHHGVTIRYQNDSAVYTITGHQDPLTPIKIAAALKP